jgi:hypothetical protein
MHGRLKRINFSPSPMHIISASECYAHKEKNGVKIKRFII